MIPETSVDWKAFEYKYSDNPQRAFENLTYYLFCHEFEQKNGIFRYFNQPHIETNPIQIGKKLIGFQSKYYSDSVAMSSKESELISAVRGASKAYPGITTLYFYISHEFSPSSMKDIVKPAYQEHIENEAQKLNIEIVWRAKSNIEAQLMQDSKFTVCRNVFFQVDSAVQTCCDNWKRHAEDIFHHIGDNVTYKENTIYLEYNKLDIRDFLNSDNQILIIDGEAGSGKSALVKQSTKQYSDDISVLFAFKSTDMDVDNKLKFLNLYGSMTISEVLDVYSEANNRVLYIDAAEKYFVLENQHIFEDMLADFIHADWKVILTIRTAYMESLHNTLLNHFKVQNYHINLINHEQLLNLSNTYGFKIPQDRQLIDILGAPFYLGLYLALDDLDKEEMMDLTKEVFEKKIWEDIIRCNKKQKMNMPTRRESVILDITMHMIQNESYVYTIQATDDHEALSALEQNGVLIQTDDSREYYLSHDVFEELVANHIFKGQYRNNIFNKEFFKTFSPSLRIRKLFRAWLADFASIDEEKHNIIFQILNYDDINEIWKNEVLLTVISTESLKDVYYKITSNMLDTNYEMLKKIAFLINTCCRVANHTEIYLNKGILFPFRLSKPCGYAWEELFKFILNNAGCIDWDEELLSIIIELLDSWTKHIENAKTENTKIAGKIGLFLFGQISNDEHLRYVLEDKTIEKLQDVLLNSAWMIKEDLKQLLQLVLAETQNMPNMYINLAERAVSDIYHFGNMPYAMPEMTIKLMTKLWLNQNYRVAYHGIDIDEDFGLASNLQYRYYPASAYKTPILGMLTKNLKQTMDFLIDLFNKTGNSYFNSHLNTEYKECFSIMIHVEDELIEQIASKRLWKMYRGTHVGSNLLVSLLMGVEQWFLSWAKDSKTDDIVKLCRYILVNSKNVMLTSIIVSIAEVYPDKMFDIVCDILKTKEIFHLDSDRYTSENSASFLLSGDTSIFEKERIDSNKLQHRNKRLEDIILNYQVPNHAISEENFNAQIQKLYKSIDETIVNIDTWQTQDKYAYYRMDLRCYKDSKFIKSDDEGCEVYEITPQFSEDMKKHSKQIQRIYDSRFKYNDLQLWSDYKFHGNNKFQKYTKYLNVITICQEVKELWDFLCNIDKHHNECNNDKSLLRYRYISIISYTSVVLIRDYKDDLTDNDKELFENIILYYGDMFAQVSDFQIAQVGNGVEAIATGLVLAMNENNCNVANNKNPLYLLLKLALKSWGENGCIIKQIEENIWKHNKSSGLKFVYVYSLFADKYENERMRNRELYIDDFFKSNQSIIEQALKKDLVYITDIDFSRLSEPIIFTIISLVSPKIKEAVIVAESTKDIIMKNAFVDRNNMHENFRDLTVYIFNYITWLSDVLLYCDDIDRETLISSFIDRADMQKSDYVEYFFTQIIQEQHVHRKVKEFWNIWELFKPTILKLNSNKLLFRYSSKNTLVGKDKIVASYLFANTLWNKNLHKCELLSEERIDFFDDFIDKSDSLSVELYAISKLLNTVGKETYRECGIEWIYKIIQRYNGQNILLYEDTLFYLEEYVGNFVYRHRLNFRMNVELAKKTQVILEYMVNQGSQIAFFVREQI